MRVIMFRFRYTRIDAVIKFSYPAERRLKIEIHILESHACRRKMDRDKIHEISSFMYVAVNINIYHIK